MKEFTAKNPLNGMTIHQRFFPETKEKFMKVTPKNLAQIVVPQLKKQLSVLPVEIEESETGWIKIKKLQGADDNEDLQKAGQSAIENITGDTAFDKEVNLMKKSGFIVTVKDGERNNGE